MQLILTTVLPIFAIILCGFLAGRFRIMPDGGAGALNTFVYYFALPALLFASLAEAPVEDITNISFIAVNALTVLTTLLVSLLIFLFVFRKAFPDVALYGMASSFGNTGFLGIPFLITAFGQEAAVPAALANFIYDILILTTVIISFEVSKAMKNQSEEAGFASVVRSVSKAIFIDPINIALTSGIVIAFLPLNLPEPMFVFTDILGAAAGPTALFALGIGLVNDNQQYRLKDFRFAELGTIIGLKLVFQPLVAAFLIFFFFPLDQLDTVSIILLSALPTGALVYVFAERYKAFREEAPILILLSTILSIFTLSMIVIFLEGI